MQLIEIEGVQALFGGDENVLIACLRVDPRRGAVDAERAAVEHFRETGAHVHLGRRRQSIARQFRRRRRALLALAPPRRSRRRQRIDFASD